MPIIFSLICRNYDKILCEFSDYHGNFEQITRSLIKKCQTSNKASITYDRSYIFHYMTINSWTYLAMCDADYPIDTAFEYLGVIQDNFEEKFKTEQIETAYSYSFNNEFRSVWESKMKFYNTNINTQETNQLEKLKSGLITTKTQLLESTALLGERGDKLQIIVKKADLLRSDSISFIEGAMKVKQRRRRRRVRYIILIIFLLVAIYFGLTYWCGGWMWNSCVELIYPINKISENNGDNTGRQQQQHQQQ